MELFLGEVALDGRKFEDDAKDGGEAPAAPPPPALPHGPSDSDSPFAEELAA